MLSKLQEYRPLNNRFDEETLQDASWLAVVPEGPEILVSGAVSSRVKGWIRGVGSIAPCTLARALNTWEEPRASPS
jgi:hypothetical protein